MSHLRQKSIGRGKILSDLTQQSFGESRDRMHHYAEMRLQMQGVLGDGK